MTTGVAVRCDALMTNNEAATRDEQEPSAKGDQLFTGVLLYNVVSTSG